MLGPNYVREIIIMTALCQKKIRKLFEHRRNHGSKSAPGKKREVLRLMAAPSITRWYETWKFSLVNDQKSHQTYRVPAGLNDTCLNKVEFLILDCDACSGS